MSKLLLKKSLLLIVILGITSVLSEVFSQKANYTHEYCLDFHFDGLNSFDWQLVSINMSANVNHDYSDQSTDGVGVVSMYIPNPFNFNNQFVYRDRLKVNLFGKKKLLLPAGRFYSRGKIAMTCKGENLKQTRLIIKQYDQYETVLQIDTLQAICRNSGDKWQTFEKNISLAETVFLEFQIVAEGIDDTYKRPNPYSNNTCGHIDSTCNQALYLKKIDIYLEGKHIDEYPLNGRLEAATINKEDICVLSFDNNRTYEQIPELKTKRIIALGETVHGSETMADMAVRLMKYQVENNNCKLIVFEKMGEEMLPINRFIQGDTSVRYDQIVEPFAYPQGSLNTLFSLTQFRDLCLWLKDYNETAAEKVWLLGMDYESIVLNRRMALAEYLLVLNEQYCFSFINEMCAELLKSSKDANLQNIDRIIQLWESNKEFLYPLIGLKETEIVGYFLSGLSNLPVAGEFGSLDGIRKRDSLMSENLMCLVNTICDKQQTAVVSAHFFHTNYVNDGYVPSLGYYAKKQFGDDYFNIALVAASGRCVTFGNGVETIELQAPEKYSIESCLNQTGMDHFYVPAIVFKDKLLSIRDCGSGFLFDQFNSGPISPIGRMGGVIFSKYSTPVKKPDVRPNELNTRIQKALQRLKILSEKLE